SRNPVHDCNSSKTLRWLPWSQCRARFIENDPLVGLLVPDQGAVDGLSRSIHNDAMSVLNLAPERVEQFRPPDAPDHLQLPETDGLPVDNFLEFYVAGLLTDSLWPLLQRLHPDGQFAVGQSSGIYWRHTSPPLEGCKAPDWFYVPGVPPTVDGNYRRSYV